MKISVLQKISDQRFDELLIQYSKNLKGRIFWTVFRAWNDRI